MAATIGTKIHTWLFGRHVGTDPFGNRYFEAKRARSHRRHTRWVMYHGIVEASKVPAEWHGWLHYTLEEPLSAAHAHAWQKEHQPNLTGTTGRYLPAGSIVKGGHRAAAAADYEPWTPQ